MVELHRYPNFAIRTTRPLTTAGAAISGCHGSQIDDRDGFARPLPDLD
jgi:hypothetical protein